MTESTTRKDSPILHILEKNIGKKNAQKILKTLSGTDTKSITSQLKKTLQGKIPETRLEKLINDFSNAKTILPETQTEKITEPQETKNTTITSTQPKKYHIQNELGRGGMGAVYRAKDTDFERNIALKTIIGSPNDNKVKRFIREARLTGKLEHPNIIPVHDFGMNSNGEHYFTMKQVKGEELKSILSKISKKDQEYCEKYTQTQLLSIFSKILEGIGFAHSKRVIHRDLKPENIMVGEFGEVQIMDWGLAKDKTEKEILSEEEPELTEEGLTLDGQIMGSPGFMPPEQADGRTEDIDERSDIWALGAILYNILSFKRPVEGNSVREILINTATGKIVPLKERKDNIPKELESIAMKAVSPDKKERYRSVAKFKEDIDAFMEKRLVTAHKYSPLQKINKWAQRHPTFTVGSGIAALLLTAGLGISAIFYQESRIAKTRADAESTRADKEALEKKLAQQERDALETEIKGQSQSLATLESIKFINQNQGYHQATLKIINKAITESKQFWKPYLVRAKHQATFGKYEKAEQDFEKAQKLFKKQHKKESTEIWFEAGMHYGLPEEIGGRGLEDKALQYFEKAFATNPEDSFGKLAHTAELIIKSRQNPEKAEEWLPKAIDIAEELTIDEQAKAINATWLVYAWALGASVFADYDDNPSFLKNTNLEQAKDALLHVVSQDKKDINIRNFLAAIYTQIGEHEKAIQIYSELFNTTKRPHILNNRGAAYTKKGDLENAIADFKKVLAFFPNSPAAHLNLGIAYYENNQLEQALDEFNLVIQRLDSENPDAYISRGNVYRKQKNYSEAKQDYQTAVRLNPKHDNAHVKLGIIHAITGEWHKAFEEYDLVIKTLNPKNSEAYFQRGNVHIQNNDLEKALQDFNETIRLKPNYLNALINRGFIYGLKQDWQRAIQDLESAVKINPADGKAHNNLAFYYSNINQHEKAESAIQKSIDLNFPLAYVTHGEILMKKGDYDEAEQAFREAYEKAPQHKQEIDRHMQELEKLREK